MLQLSTIKLCKSAHATTRTYFERRFMIHGHFESTFSKYAFGRGGGGHKKEYAVYARENDDKYGRPLNEPGILKLHKAAGPDNIKPILLKQLAIEFFPIPTIIFNTLLETGVVPSEWRNANVVPIYKKCSRYNASNYRPISLTCIRCEILEHVIASAKTTLSPVQHGFRRNRSRETQLIPLMHKGHICDPTSTPPPYWPT